MRLIYKILLWHLSIVVLLAAVGTVGFGGISIGSFLSFIGLVSLGVAIADLIVSLVLFAAGSKELAKGYLLSSGILLIIGLGTCGSMWIDTQGHF